MAWFAVLAGLGVAGVANDLRSGRYVDWAVVLWEAIMIALVGILVVVFPAVLLRREERERAAMRLRALVAAGRQARNQAAASASQIRRPRVGTHPDICPYCQSAILLQQDPFLCPICKTPHHRECWRENGGCTTYGCTARM